MIAGLNWLTARGSDGRLIELISQLEHLRAACAAAQIQATHNFTAQYVADGAARGIRPEMTRRSVVGQIALAHRESPHAGRRLVSQAEVLVTDLPLTLAALAAGEATDRQVRGVVEQFSCLTPQARRAADRQIAGDLPGLGTRGAEEAAARIAARLDPAAVMAKIRAAVKNRHVTVKTAPDAMSRLTALLPVEQGKAVQAALKALADQAAGVPGGDARTRGQIMADALVARITGRSAAGCDEYGVPEAAVAPNDGSDPTSAATAAEPPAHSADGSSAADSAGPESDGFDWDGFESDGSESGGPETNGPESVGSESGAHETDGPESGGSESDRSDRRDHDEADQSPADRCNTCGCDPDSHHLASSAGTSSAAVQLSVVMTDKALFGGDEEPAHIVGHGTIPAALARSMLARHADDGTTMWIRRFYTNAAGTGLITADSKQRLFPRSIAQFLITRDQICRTPFCDAPIRHLDHVKDHHRGGATNISNGQGLCAACNLIKIHPAWTVVSSENAERDGSITTITTPTGHTHRSTPPLPPQANSWAQEIHIHWPAA